MRGVVEGPLVAQKQVSAVSGVLLGPAKSMPTTIICVAPARPGKSVRASARRRWAAIVFRFVTARVALLGLRLPEERTAQNVVDTPLA